MNMIVKLLRPPDTDGWGSKLVTIFARHLDNFLAKVPGLSLVLSSGNTPPLQAGSSLSRHNMSGLDARPSILPGR